MPCQIVPLHQIRRTAARRHCDAISLAEDLAHQALRWWAAMARDQMRFWWRV